MSAVCPYSWQLWLNKGKVSHKPIISQKAELAVLNVKWKIFSLINTLIKLRVVWYLLCDGGGGGCFVRPLHLCARR
jgi:hypothetical protein